MSTLSREARTEAPGSTAEAAELLASTSGPVLVRGGSTSLDWGGTVRPVDLVIDTTALAGRVEHNPADLTVAVAAGTRLVDLQDQLAAAGQWLPYDPPTEPAGATLGGLLATGESGPSRLRHGPLRDLVIGSTLVLADGTVAHSGGHVIKNVAGYDLTKIASGSLGTLALVAELVLRVHPRPPASCTLLARTGLPSASAAALRLFSSTVEPAALEWSTDDADDGGAGRFLVRIDGSARRVAAAPELLRRALGELDPGLEPLGDADAETSWSDHRDRAVGAGDAVTVVLQGLPDRVPALVADVVELAGRGRLRVGTACSLAVGTVVVGWSEETGSDQASLSLLTDLRQVARTRGATLLLRRRPSDLPVDGTVAVGPPPSSAVLLRRLKAGLDPSNRFAPGRFEPWY